MLKVWQHKIKLAWLKLEGLLGLRKSPLPPFEEIPPTPFAKGGRGISRGVGGIFPFTTLKQLGIDYDHTPWLCHQQLL